MSLARPPLPARRSSIAPPPPPPRRSSQNSGTNDEVETTKPMGIAARIASLQLDQVGRLPVSGKLPGKVQPVTPVTPEEEGQEAPPSLPPRRKSVPTPVEEQKQGQEDEEAPPLLPPRRRSVPIPVEEPEQEQEEEEAPPSLPPRRKSAPLREQEVEALPSLPLRRKSAPPPVPQARRPTWKEIEARGADFVRAVSRKPPPTPSAQEPKQPPARRLPPKPARLPTPPPEPEPLYEEPLEQGSSDTACIKCHDFSVVDDHAAEFPRETVASLDQLAYDLTSPWESETEKCRAIFTWLHHNIAYDAENFFCGTVQASTPEQTLRSGLAVCDGYAGLFSALAERAGLQAMKVTGHGKGFGYIPTEAGGPVPRYQGNHAWNCALMDGEWRLIDSCWGAGTVDGQGYIKRFATTWFTSSNAEFGKRHYPEDPAYQLISDEDGGPVSWEDYILEPEGPVVFNDFATHNFSPHYLQPSTKCIQGGTWVTFHLFKLCEHISTAQAVNYVHLISLPDQSRTPLTLNAEGGWSATVYVPPESGDLSLFYVTTFGGEDAKGLGVEEYNAGVGRKGMSFGGLCRWTVV